MADEAVSRQVALMLAVADKQARKATQDALEAIPRPKDGQDGLPGKDGARGPKGDPGERGEPGPRGLECEPRHHSLPPTW